MYFQESRFGSLDVVFVENDHLLTGAQYTMTQNVAGATAFIVGRLLSCQQFRCYKYDIHNSRAHNSELSPCIHGTSYMSDFRSFTPPVSGA